MLVSSDCRLICSPWPSFIDTKFGHQEPNSRPPRAVLRSSEYEPPKRMVWTRPYLGYRARHRHFSARDIRTVSASVDREVNHAKLVRIWARGVDLWNWLGVPRAKAELTWKSVLVNGCMLTSRLTEYTSCIVWRMRQTCTFLSAQSFRWIGTIHPTCCLGSFSIRYSYWFSWEPTCIP